MEDDLRVIKVEDLSNHWSDLTNFFFFLYQGIRSQESSTFLRIWPSLSILPQPVFIAERLLYFDFFIYLTLIFLFFTLWGRFCPVLCWFYDLCIYFHEFNKCSPLYFQDWPLSLKLSKSHHFSQYLNDKVSILSNKVISQIIYYIFSLVILMSGILKSIWLTWLGAEEKSICPVFQ